MKVWWVNSTRNCLFNFVVLRAPTMPENGVPKWKFLLGLLVKSSCRECSLQKAVLISTLHVHLSDLYMLVFLSLFLTAISFATQPHLSVLRMLIVSNWRLVRIRFLLSVGVLRLSLILTGDDFSIQLSVGRTSWALAVLAALSWYNCNTFSLETLPWIGMGLAFLQLISHVYLSCARSERPLWPGLSGENANPPLLF